MIYEFAPAKINLFLHVGAPRSDGYHPLVSLAVFADLGDVLTAHPAEDLTLDISGPFASDLTAKADNLVLRAARALQNASGCTRGAHLNLEKNLPIASGIGGGSADAAAALRLLNRLWGLDYTPARLCAIAADLGADVPVCVLGRAALMRGTGVQIAPVDVPRYAAVLVNSGTPVPTAAVYRRYDAGGVFGSVDPPANLTDLIACRNDLEAVACTLVPAVGETLSALRSLPGADMVRMSGSGGTCFALFSDRQKAQSAADLLRARHPQWWIVPSVLNG